MTERWFGRAWNGECMPSGHIPVPVGRCCLECHEPIVVGQSGVVRPITLEDGTPRLAAIHLECVARSYRPHGVECPHCRGHRPSEHDEACGSRQGGDYCTCRLSPFFIGAENVSER